MSNSTSPVHIPRNDMDGPYDPSFTADINNKMRVPKRIRVTGDSDSDDTGPVHWQRPSYNNSEEKFEMHVPDRILVVGRDQHMGTRAPPRELVLENAVMPPDPGIVRVQTPPRVISLDQHMFPTVEGGEPAIKGDSEDSDSGLGQNGGGHLYDPSSSVLRMANMGASGDSEGGLLYRESHPGSETSLAPSEELQHLRRQVARLNRRMMVLEVEHQGRQQRERFYLTIGAVYFVFKALTVLHRALSRN